MSGPTGFDVDDPVLARAAWSRLAEPTDLEAFELVAEHGASRALRQVLGGRAARRWRLRVPDLDPVRDVATVRRLGGQIVIPRDDQWPAGLADLGEYAPFCLWVRGALPVAGAVQRSVAVVGSRAATGYGEHVASGLAAGCVDRGIAVVSGAAYGVDGAAHRGALAAGGTTVAVLACGVDRYYPSGHEELIRRVLAAGCVVSEIPPGSSPTRWRFLERNRLIAAMTQGTVVVEAAWRSGALSTAERAGKLGRPVGAVPGPVTGPMSVGCHRLLRDGASCVTDAAEVAELIARIGEDLAPDRRPPRTVRDELDPVARQVLDALPVRQGAAASSIARVAGVDERKARRALELLEGRRLAVREGWLWRLRPTGGVTAAPS